MLRPGPTPPPDLRLRIRGALLGAVLGDAFGAPFEMASPGSELSTAVHERDGAVRPWSYTDDGEMTIGIAESIAERSGWEPEHALHVLAERHDPARGYGSGTRRVFEAVRAGKSPDEAAAASGFAGGSEGNGAALRVAGLAALFHRDAAARTAAAIEGARLTHRGETAMAAALVMTNALASLLRAEEPGRAWLASLAEAPEAAGLRDRLALALSSFDAPLAETARALGTGVLARESVPFALLAFARSPRKHETLMDAVACGGDADSTGSMIGALLGAANGPGVFPRLWAHNLEDGARGREHVITLADAIHDLVRDESRRR